MTASGHIGLIEELLLVFVSVVPCAIVFGWSAWPFYAIWVTLGGARARHGDRKVLQDGFLFGVLSTLLLRQEIVEAVLKVWHESLKDARSFAITSAVATVALVVIGYMFRRNDDRKVHPERLPSGTHPWSLEHPKPAIIPCRTTHTRLFPKKHSFGYNYLLCGFPIVPAGTAPNGTELPEGSDSILGRWWMRIKAEDYLTRGQGSLGFYGKLKAFLRDKGVKESEWTYAYLVTAPRFFGYAFNPASFWYIYNHEHELARMITEVNNTFGERHLYLLDGTSPPLTPDEEGPMPTSSKTTFTDYWAKEFHVSPFNSRKGGYAQRALNPFPTPTSPPVIDITITMKSSKDHPKIIARLYSVTPALELEKLSYVQILKFIAVWGWSGFLTFPRIIKEAYVLYFRRGLHVWFRPEVLASSIGRLPSSTESFLQTVFTEYLFYLVHLSKDPFCITYETAIPDKPKDVIATTHRRVCNRDVKMLDIRVSTGAFYSRFVHYAHTSEAFDRECLFTDEKNRTLWISQPSLLQSLLPKTMHKLKEDEKPVKRNYLDDLRWNLLRKLRCPPAEPAYPVSPKSAAFEIDDIREHTFSELDRFVRGPAGTSYAGAYRRVVTKIFLAQRFAFGLIGIIDSLDFCLRVAFCWVGACMMASCTQPDEHSRDSSPDILRWATAMSLGLCHVYGLSKGYR